MGYNNMNYTIHSIQYSLSEHITTKGHTVEVFGYRITIDSGFIWDGASVPKLAQPIVGSPFTGLYQRAALFHDALYACKGLSRKLADRIFLILMLSDGVSVSKAITMYNAVRIGGWYSWSRHTKESVAEARGQIQIERISNDA